METMTADNQSTEATPTPWDRGKISPQTPPEAHSLTNKQQIFIKEYLIDFNATRAAKAAGYSELTAHASGKENLHKPTIKAAIDAEIEARKSRITFNGDKVLEELARIGFSPELSNHKVRCLELLARHLGLLHDKHEIDVKQPVRIVIRKFCSRGNPDGSDPAPIGGNAA